MTTIFVIYSDLPVTTPFGRKQYPFNTNSNLKIGDRLRSPDYTTDMQVTAVFKKAFKYINRATGVLGNELISTEQVSIRELRLTDGSANVKVKNVIKAHKVYSNRILDNQDEADPSWEDERNFR